jgi:pyruvate dehydrogenase E1 component beta subunit
MEMTMKEEMSYRDAIRAALAEEMRRDPAVLLMGEDIAAAGGVFKATEGLLKEFGPIRVRDTPISEMGFVGAALGLAITGYRPVVELMFADFIGVCHDQIVNQIAKYRYMSGGQATVPLVIRALGGAGLRFASQHSQTCETWLLATPGLRIVCPSSPNDVYGMLKAAIRDENPVVVIEHKALYGTKGQVQLGKDPPANLDRPAVARTGNGVTIVASLAMVPRSLEAAELLAERGVDAEVIDLRVLRPMDVGPIVTSVRKTSLLLTVEEGPQVGGWGAEVVAQVTAEAFDYLDGPPQRVTLPDHPIPFSPPLEDAALPNPQQIADAVTAMRG